MCSEPQFTEATGILTLEGVIFSMRFCVYIYIKIIASSCYNLFYIQIHHFIQQTMLTPTLYYTIRWFAVLYLFIQQVQSFLLSNAKVGYYGPVPVVKES